MNQNIEQLCDEEVKPVEIERKEVDKDYLFLKKFGYLTSSLAAVPGLYDKISDGKIQNALSNIMLIGMFFIAVDLTLDYIVSPKTNRGTKNE